MRDALLVILGLIVVVLLAADVYQNQRRLHRPLLTTEYQRVTLQNGEVYYGRIDHLGTDYPVLRDAMTIREEQGGSAREPRYVVKLRTSEPHGADHIVFPATSLVSVEPVRPDSTIGKLIAEAQPRR